MSGRFQRLLSSFRLGQSSRSTVLGSTAIRDGRSSRSTVLGSTSIRDGRSSRSTVLLISQPGRRRRIPSRRDQGRCSAFPPRRAPQSQHHRPPFPFISLKRPLPESSNLRSVYLFAECIPSGTRRTNSLPSAILKTLDKKTLGKNGSLPSVKQKTLDK